MYLLNFMYTLGDIITYVKNSYSEERRDLFDEFFVYKGLDQLIPVTENDINSYTDTIVDKDIDMALCNILSSGEKFANQKNKIDVFIAQLEQGRKVFLNEFLKPQMAKIAEEMGFPLSYISNNIQGELSLPNYWLQFKHQNEAHTIENPNIPKIIGSCVLESIDLDYAPNGFAAYESVGENSPSKGGTGTPVATRMTLRFRETTIVTKQDFETARSRKSAADAAAAAAKPTVQEWYE
mgnify:CR=1 FL=1